MDNVECKLPAAKVADVPCKRPAAASGLEAKPAATPADLVSKRPTPIGGKRAKKQTKNNVG